MRFAIAIAVLIWAFPVTAQTIDCKSIVSPLERLHCFDASTTAPGPKSVWGVVETILETPATAAAIFAAALAFISGVLGPWVQRSIARGQIAVAQQAAQASQTAADASMLTARNVGNREIARLRDVLSEYHAILMNDQAPDAQTHRRLLQLGTELDLLLNPEDQVQKRLWDIADEIFKSDDFEARKNRDADLMAAGRAVFNGEWRKIKAEMRGEEFQTGE
jgi:hypothetical protein